MREWLARKNPMRDVVSRLRAIDRKLDVLIEAQGLEAKLAEREALDREVAAQQRESRPSSFAAPAVDNTIAAFMKHRALAKTSEAKASAASCQRLEARPERCCRARR